MNSSNVLRIAFLISLILLAQLQFSVIQRSKTSTTKPYSFENSFDNQLNIIPYDLPFPLVNKSAQMEDVKNAEKHLKLPTWANGYKNCDENGTEVSCYEIVRASDTVKSYERLIEKGSFKGQIYVDAADFPLEDRMTMLYHAIQIGLATSREVHVKRGLFPFHLPGVIKDVDGKISGTELPSDYQFGCANVGQRFPKLLINNVTWPQALYTHHMIAPFLRNKFGFHAAYFLGNYLFGTEDKPKSDCFVDSINHVVEIHKFPDGGDMLRSWDYTRFIDRCGVPSGEDALAISNDDNMKSRNTNFKQVEYLDNENESFVCNLRRMVSAKHLVFTFGSRYGFWGAAMSGRKGGFVNGIDRICINVTNSQCGSLWHTYCQEEKNSIFKTNNRLFVCGPNVYDVNLYVDYLLW